MQKIEKPEEKKEQKKDEKVSKKEEAKEEFPIKKAFEQVSTDHRKKTGRIPLQQRKKELND